MNLFKSLKQDTWVKPFVKKYQRMLVLAVTLSFFTFFCGAALMFSSGFLISRAASSPENILLIYVPVVLTRAFGILRPVFRYIERLTSHNWVLKITSSLRKKLYLSLEKEGIFLYEKFQLGDLLGILSEDIGHLQNLYLRTIFPLLTAFVLYAFVVIGLGYFSLLFALFMLLFLFVVVILFPVISVLKTGALQEKKKTLKNELYTTLTDNVLGVSDWIFSGRKDAFLLRYDEEEQKVARAEEKIKSFRRTHNLLLEIFFGFLVCIVFIWASRTFGSTQLAANWIAAFVLCIFPLIDAFAPLSDAVTEANIYADSVTRLNELPDETDEETVEKIDLKGRDIVLTDVCFAYAKEEGDMLKNLHLTIRKGEKIAILGRSGAGKSTLARLIRGDLVPSAGSIQLGGVEVGKLQQKIHKNIGVIHQTPYLFHTTLLNNLRIGNEEASEEEVWAVLEIVGLKAMVENLPDKLQTMVDEAGLRFSGGQRHRIALARILLSKVDIVLLDEPTTALDPITEQKLLEAMFDALKDKTVIWITHHLLGIDKMERVLFMKDGLLVMDGDPAVLEEENDSFSRLLQLDRGW